MKEEERLAGKVRAKASTFPLVAHWITRETQPTFKRNLGYILSVFLLSRDRGCQTRDTDGGNSPSRP